MGLAVESGGCLAHQWSIGIFLACAEPWGEAAWGCQREGTEEAMIAERGWEKYTRCRIDSHAKKEGLKVCGETRVSDQAG